MSSVVHFVSRPPSVSNGEPPSRQGGVDRYAERRPPPLIIQGISIQTDEPRIVGMSIQKPTVTQEPKSPSSIETPTPNIIEH